MDIDVFPARRRDVGMEVAVGMTAELGDREVSSFARVAATAQRFTGGTLGRAFR